VQSEYAGAYATKTDGTTHPINSCYAQVSYFLTGENRVYDRNMGCWTRVKPYENFFRVRTCDDDVCTGKGAWEIAYRCDYIDYSKALSTAGIISLATPAPSVSAPAEASQFTNHTLGLSWYLNPFTKMMFNYVYSTEHPLAGSNNYLSVYEMRAQIDF
jgi:phosphate-selective porin OprO/OprP